MDSVNRPLHLLLIALPAELGKRCSDLLAKAGVSFDLVELPLFDRPSGFSLLPFDAVFLGHRRGERELPSRILEIRKSLYHGPVIVLADAEQEEETVQAIKAGADDFLSPARWPLVGEILRTALHAGKLAGQTPWLVREDERCRKLEAMSRMAGHIAHALNNDLTVLMGNLSLIQGASAVENDLDKFVGAAERACRKAGALSQRLFLFARGKAPKLEAFSLNGLLEQVARCQLREGHCQIDAPRMTPDSQIVSDPDLLAWILGQLLQNAAASMPSGGRVRISVDIVNSVSGDRFGIPDGPVVRLAIADAGVGIAPEFSDRVFDPFFSTRKGGEGMGLALAHVYAKKLGGHLTFMANPDGGAIFFLLFPTRCIAEKRLQSLQKEPERQSLGPRGRILVMDDEVSIRDLLGMALREVGYDVGLAGDGEEAVGLVRAALQENRPYSVAILDLSIPGGMGGSETLRNLRLLDPSIRAIVSSGLSDHQILDEFRKEGFDEAIAKPYDLDEMFRLIEKTRLHSREN